MDGDVQCIGVGIALSFRQQAELCAVPDPHHELLVQSFGNKEELS
jgi:hypothetical protein